MSKRVAARASGGVEYRTVPLGSAQVSDNGQLAGLAVRFDSPTMIGDPDWGFRESFAPGAFTKTLAESDVVLLDNHDTAKPIARVSAGTLRCWQDDGLRWEANPTSQASYINDVRENVKAGNYGGCSFGFRAVKEDWLDDAGNQSDAWSGTQRVVREAQLFEISDCTFPAYGDTEVMTRDAVSALRESRAGGAPRNVEGSEQESAAESTDTRDDPDGMEYAAIDSAIDYLNAGNADEALRVLQANQDSRSSSVVPKPEESTSEPSFDLRIYKFRLESSKPKDDE